MENNYKHISEIESELYALVISIINLSKKYHEGTLNHNFYEKSIHNAMKGLLKINLYFNERDIPLITILNKMNFIEEYNHAVRIFKELSAVKSPEELVEVRKEKPSNFTDNMGFSLLELPGITSEITSSLITLMDALKLDGLKNSELIFKLFKDLKQNITKFPGLEEMQFKINEIYTHVNNNPQKLIEDKRFRNIIVDKLYHIFKEFQHKLTLKPNLK